MQQLKMDSFDKWIEDLVFPKEVEDFVEVLYDGGQGEGDDNFEIRKQILFYTYNNKYTITAIETGNGNGYLHCQVVTRKPRAGEHWPRGNNLSNGPFTLKMLEQIKNGIIAYELEQLSVKKPQDPMEEMILNEHQTCTYGNMCPYTTIHDSCQGLNSQRKYVFNCNYVKNGKFIRDGEVRNPLDLTGKMKILTEG